MYQKCLCEYKVILSMYSEGANEKCRAHTVWHDLRAGRSLQATFNNTEIQLCPALSLQLGRPWIITLAILSMGGKKILHSMLPDCHKKKKKTYCWNSCRARLGGFWRSKPEDNTLNYPKTPQSQRKREIPLCSLRSWETFAGVLIRFLRCLFQVVWDQWALLWQWRKPDAFYY